MAAAKKQPARRALTKTVAKRSKRAENEEFMLPLRPTGPLVAIVGANPVPRNVIIEKLWRYIKKNNLQDKKDSRMINADEKLRPLFGKEQASMFELTAFISRYLNPVRGTPSRQSPNDWSDAELEASVETWRAPKGLSWIE